MRIVPSIAKVPREFQVLALTLNVLLSSLLGKSRSIVSNTSDCLWSVDPHALSILNDGNRRRMLQFFGVELDHVVNESGVFLMSCVNLSVVEISV